MGCTLTPSLRLLLGQCVVPATVKKLIQQMLAASLGLARHLHNALSTSQASPRLTFLMKSAYRLQPHRSYTKQKDTGEITALFLPLSVASLPWN